MIYIKKLTLLVAFISLTLRAFAQVPTISSFTPTSGPVGAAVTISGSNFSTTTTNNIVMFGATQATVTAATATQLTITVPTGATYAPITVLNISTGLRAYSTVNFIPTFTPNKGSIDITDFETKVDFTTGTDPFSIAIGDLDGDGKADLAVANNTSSTISVFRNIGSSGTINYANKVDLITGSSPRFVAIGDLDGDGKAELVTANYNSSGTISIFRNIGSSGTINYNTKVDLTTGSFPYSIAISDLDGDGKADLAVANAGGSNYISVFRNTGGIGSISYAAKVDFASGSNPYSVSVGDLNGDGKADLAVANYNSNTVSVFRNTSSSGTINFDTKVDFATGAIPRCVVIGDLDGDGKADLTIANNSSNSISTFRNVSSGGVINFDAKVDYTTGAAPFAIAIGDLDGDGRADLAVANGDGNSSSIFRNASSIGTISYATKVDISTGQAPRTVAIGDLDGDGRADLALANFNSSTVSIVRNNPVFLLPTISLFNPTSSGNTGTVTITGTNFTGVTDVSFGGTPATSFNVISSTSITAIVGTGTSGNVAVTTPGGTASLAGFTFVPPPTISSFNPTSGTAGTSVTITGTNFDPTPANNIVKFNGTIATVSASTATSITTTVPAGATSGTISVKAFGESTSLNSFTVVQAPTITSFNPTSGNIGATVTITGTNFDTTPTNNTVKFNGTTATVTASTATSITTTVPSGATTGKISVTANALTGESTGNFTVLDSTPPQITDATSSSVAAGSDLTITATITDNESGISDAKVEHRSIAAGAGTSLSSTNLTANGNSYSATITGSAVGELGIEYKISATSSGGTSTSGSSFKQVKVSSSAGLSIPYNSFGNSVSNYRIIAIPLDLNSKSVSSVFDELGAVDHKKWRMYRYDNGSTSELSGNSTIVTGQGYWLIVKDNPGEMTTGAGTSVSSTTDAPFEINLKADWNQIGNPYNFNLDWADVQAANPGIGELTVFNGDFANATRLDKMQGGFVKVNAAQKLIFPVAKNTSVNGRQSLSKEPEFLNPLSEPNWQVRFIIQDGIRTNSISGFGMNEKASDGFDAFDRFNMPAFFDDYLVLKHNHKVGKDFYSSEIVPTAAEYVWSFEIESTSKNELITLHWDNTSLGTNDKELFLWDINLQKAVNMREVNHYTFNKTQSQSFNTIFGSPDFIKEKIAVYDLVLHAPFPNPSASDVRFSFSLPESSSSYTVEYTILDVMGRTYVQSSGNFGSGYNELTWQRNQQEPGGLYFIKLQVGSSSRIARFVIRN